MTQAPKGRRRPVRVRGRNRRVLRGLGKWNSPHLTDRHLEQLLRSRKKPNGSSIEKLIQPLSSGNCSCPRELIVYDPELGLEVCSIHGIEPNPDLVSTFVDLAVTGPEKFSRQPDNAAVFRHNRGSTTLAPLERRRGIHEKSQLTAVTGMYGSRDGSLPGSQKQIRTCPGCSREQIVEVFGPTLKCANEKCGVKLGDYALIWQPYVPKDRAHNGMNNSAMMFWNDLRRLGAWDPVEDDFIYKKARELFSQRFDGDLSDENASHLAGLYMKRVQNLVRAQRKGLPKLLESLLDSLEGANS